MEKKETMRIIRCFKKDISSMKYEKKCFKGLEQKEEKQKLNMIVEI